MGEKNSEEIVHIDMYKNHDQKDLGMRREDSKKNNFRKYAENNSVGGLSYVLTSKSKIRRCIWLVIILVCVGLCLYLLRNSFSKLLNPPTSTTIINDPNLSLEFPAVTICNINAFSAEILSSYAIAIEDIRKTYIYRDDDYPILDDLNITLGQLANTFANNVIDLCFYGDHACDIDNDFEFSLTELYACFTFNSGRKKPIQKVNGTGVNNGLTLSLNINEDDYSATVIRDAGVKIVVHPQDEPPHPDRFGVAASPGTNMHISFKKQIFDDQTHRACLADDQKKWMHLSEEVSYSYASCLKDSFIDISISNCGCVLSTDYLSSSQFTLCNLSNLNCYIDYYFAEPRKPCRPACKRTSFEITSATHTKFPADYAINEYNATDEVMFVNIYYETLNVQTQTTMYSYGVEEFFAEVGGQLGLFIGVSVITFFEFTIFLLDEIKNRIKSRWKILKRSRN